MKKREKHWALILILKHLSFTAAFRVGRVWVETAEETSYSLEPCLTDLGFPKAILFQEFAVHTKRQVKRIPVQEASAVILFKQHSLLSRQSQSILLMVWKCFTVQGELTLNCLKSSLIRRGWWPSVWLSVCPKAQVFVIPTHNRSEWVAVLQNTCPQDLRVLHPESVLWTSFPELWYKRTFSGLIPSWIYHCTVCPSLFYFYLWQFLASYLSLLPLFKIQ